MQQLPDTPTKSTQNISKSFEVPIQHQQYFVPNLPPQCDTNTTICLKTLDIDAKRSWAAVGPISWGGKLIFIPDYEYSIPDFSIQLLPDISDNVKPLIQHRSNIFQS